MLNEVKLTAQGKELLVEGNFVSANSTENTVAGKANFLETFYSSHYHVVSSKKSLPFPIVISIKSFPIVSGRGSTDDSPIVEIIELAGAHNQESSGANLFNTFNINEYITHSVGSSSATKIIM